MAEGEKIIPINIEEEMKSAYIDYSMSVIVSRALPDVRDGLKPVHRRVLFGMLDLGLFSNRPYKKSARIVGEVLGKYHPHGDTSVYDAMVRMAQEWSLRYPLVDGQGNFGSMDNDSPAAMRYTEARLKKIAEEMLADIDKETVNFQLNFDDSLEEPTVLPAKIPNLLINGTSGIAVGMATNMPPHNLSEVIDATMAYIDNREIDIAGLMKYVKAPDFPTGGIIYGFEGVKSAFETGRGRIMMRAHVTVEEMEGGNRERIVVTEIPYQVNKAEMIKQTADLVNDKKLEGISEIRDESDRNGLRVVYELKRDAITNVVLNNLFKYTALQTSFSVNNIALVGGRPKTLNLKDIIVCFVDHRHEVVTRRAQFDLRKAEERAHILEGLIIASDNIDEVIRIIRASQSPQLAKDTLRSTFNLSEIQSNAIVEMRLRQLTGLEQDKLRAEYAEVNATIEKLKALLASEPLRMDLIKKELLEIRDKYGDDRRTEIVYAAEDMKIEDMIPDEEVAVTISHLGYIKRTALTEYKRQNRGGKGSVGSSARDEDFLEHLFVATAHNYLLIFTEKGRCYWMRVFEIPEGQKTGKGRAIQNLINIEKDDKVMAYINVKDLNDSDYINKNFIVLCTKKGVIKKTSLELYSRPRKNGIIAVGIREGDQLLEAKLTNGKNEILMALKSGRALRFNEMKVRPMGRNASGVRGIRLANLKDEVIGMVCISPSQLPPSILENLESAAIDNVEGADLYNPEDTDINNVEDSDINDIEETDINNGEEPGNNVEDLTVNGAEENVISPEVAPWVSTILVVSERGYGKRTDIDEYRITNRGGKGVKTINITEKTGKLIAIKDVVDTDDLMIICKSGITIRMAVTDLRVIGRATQGVRLINLKEGDAIAAVTKIDASKVVTEELNGNNGLSENGTPDINGNGIEINPGE